MEEIIKEEVSNYLTYSEWVKLVPQDRLEELNGEFDHIEVGESVPLLESGSPQYIASIREEEESVCLLVVSFSGEGDGDCYWQITSNGQEYSPEFLREKEEIPESYVFCLKLSGSNDLTLKLRKKEEDTIDVIISDPSLSIKRIR